MGKNHRLTPLLPYWFTCKKIGEMDVLGFSKIVDLVFISYTPSSDYQNSQICNLFAFFIFFFKSVYSAIMENINTSGMCMGFKFDLFV